MDSYKFERRGRFYFVCDCGTQHVFFSEEERDIFGETQNCTKGFVKAAVVEEVVDSCLCEDCDCDPCICSNDVLEIDISNDQVEVSAKGWNQTSFFSKNKDS